MRKITWIFLITLCCSSLSIPSFAQYYFLNDATITYFTDEDSEIYGNAQYDALNHHGDGAKVSWSNPNTGAHGYFIPSNTTRKNGMLCRTLTIVNFAEHRSGQAMFKFCKIHNEWKVVE